MHTTRRIPPLATPDSASYHPAITRRRWIKVSVDEDLFHHLHIVAAQSRMRITPYLRRYLAEAEPYEEQFRQ